MNSVFDQQGEGWLPGTAQANKALDAAARAAQPATQQPSPPTPRQAPAPRSTTKPSNVPIGFGTPKSAMPLHGETLESRLAWVDKNMLGIAGYAPSNILKNPALFNKLFDEGRLTPQQAGFLLSEANYLHTRFGHRAFGNNMKPRNDYGKPSSNQQNRQPAIPRISTPAPKPQSTTQSQDPGFVNLPVPHVSSTPAPSSSSGIQFRVIDDIVRPISAPPSTNEPEPANSGMR